MKDFFKYLVREALGDNNAAFAVFFVSGLTAVILWIVFLGYALTYGTWVMSTVVFCMPAAFAVWIAWLGYKEAGTDE
jgi:hypothetical protein